MRYLRSTLIAAIALALCSCAGPTRDANWRDDGQRRALPGGRIQANTSNILVAEIAFARLAREEGQWTAFRETAAPDAVMFVPNAVIAQAWLKDRPDPTETVQWQASRLFMSCDGHTGASAGAWQSGNLKGYYTTVWQDQETNPRKQQRWKWVLDHGDTLDQPAVSEDDMIQSQIGSCEGDARAAAQMSGATLYSGQPDIVAPPNGMRASRDGTLLWSWAETPDGIRVVTLSLWNGEGFDEVIRKTVKVADQ